MKIFYSRYLLKKKLLLNSQDSPGSQTGALIKIVEADYWGVADICPKPELGDDSLENEIKNRGLLFNRARELAQEDLEARRAQKSLLLNKPIVNNFLVTDYKTADLNQSRYVGQTVKIKADHDILSLSRILNGLVNDLLIRLDFNSILNAEEFRTFLKLLSSETIKKIEYIEDPTVFNAEWKNWNSIVPLAFDFQRGDYNVEYAHYRIIKPSRQKIEPDAYYTLTSAMEHPVGLAHGLRIAQQRAQNISGFLTLNLFEPDVFNKYFEQNENHLNFSALALSDFGIGMSQELLKLQWDEG